MCPNASACPPATPAGIDEYVQSRQNRRCGASDKQIESLMRGTAAMWSRALGARPGGRRELGVELRRHGAQAQAALGEHGDLVIGEPVPAERRALVDGRPDHHDLAAVLRYYFGEDGAAAFARVADAAQLSIELYFFLRELNRVDHAALGLRPPPKDILPSSAIRALVELAQPTAST